MGIKASVCLITKRREPRIDLALQLLSKQTCLDFEYIICDGYFWQRREEVEELIRRMKPPFPVRYIPDKPSRWRGKRPALSNARNTCVIYARGAQLIFFDDCCVNMVSNLVSRHLEWGCRGYAVAGSWYTHPDPPYGWEFRHRICSVPRLVDGEWLHGGHHSIPLKHILAVNGWDEMFDGEQGVDDCDMGIRLSRLGVRVVYDPELYVEYDLRTHSLTQWSPDPLKQDWRSEGKPIEPKKRVLSDGREHFSNEYLIELLKEDRFRTRPLGNHFDLVRLRRIPEKYDFNVVKVHEALEQYIDPDPLDWRDGEEIAKM